MWQRNPAAAALPAGSLRPAQRGTAELAFAAEDADRRLWSLSYDLARGSLAARPADAQPSLSLSDFLTRLHKQHHYPDSLSAKWLWVLFADATALAMILWALSGLVLAWQIRPLRRIGLACLAAGCLAALAIAAANRPQLAAAAAKSQSAEAAAKTPRTSPQGT